MKKKLLILTLMLITILLVGGSSAYAICYPCSAGGHSSCLSPSSSYSTSGTSHVKKCCCGKGNVSSHTATWNAATCTKAKTCKTCGMTSGSSLGHTGGTATCTVKPVCTRCGSSYGSALGHNLINGCVSVSADYHMTKHCSRCNATGGTSEKHTWANATCTSASKCSKCGQTKSGSTALGHRNFYYDYTADSNTIHEVDKYCGVCNAHISNSTESHNWDSWTSTGYGTNYKHAKQCKNCKYVSSGYHSYGSWTYSDATNHKRSCTTSGCPSYGTEPHTASTPATCTTKAHCNVCGSDYGNALGHNYNKACSKCGTANVVCANDSSHVKTHTCHTCSFSGAWSDYSATQHRRKCSGCSNYQYENHSVSSTTYTYNNNSTNHKVTKKCSCGHVTSETNANCSFGSWTKTSDASNHWSTCSVCKGQKSAAHTFGGWTTTTGATCMATGTRQRTCSTCSYVASETIAKTDHNYSTSKITTAATCSAKGVKTYYCSYNNNHTKTEAVAIDPNAHNYSSSKITTAATCTTTGVRTYYCSYNNDHTKTESVAKDPNNHNYSKACDVCTAANIMCSRCNAKKSHTCTVDVTVPKVNTPLRYTGSAQTGVEKGSNYTLSGTTSATKVGSYTATATLAGKPPKYVWADNKSTDPRSITWQILDVAISNVTSPSDVSVKEGGTATFTVSAKAGTNVKYQWYKNTSNSSTGGTLISGATSATYTISSVSRSDNNTYYYCELSNNSSSPTDKAITKSSPAKLTVWYSPSIATEPSNKDVKKSENATFSVTLNDGNPATYTYQWYKSATKTSTTATKIQGATSASYTVSNIGSNIHEEWYYCEINNGYYTITTERARLRADVTLPVIEVGSANVEYANKDKEFTVKIKVTNPDSGTTLGFDTSSFTADDITIKVGGTQVTPTKKTLACDGTSGDVTTYTLTLSGVTGDGKLNVNVASGKIKDNFGNTNETLAQDVAGLMIDNSKPTISIAGNVTGTNGGFINKSDVITIPIKITDVGGINASTFTKEDILVKLTGVEDTGVTKTLTFIKQEGNDYIYELTVTNITKEGTLSLEIPENAVADKSGNSNSQTPLSGFKVNDVATYIIADNTKPVITSVVLKIGSYAGNEYPTSIDTSRSNWTNEDVYVTINSNDDNGETHSGVEKYQHSINGTANYVNIGSNQEIWSIEIDSDNIYYRVIDKAGNMSDPHKISLKIDTTAPSDPVVDIRHQRPNGEPYIYDPSKSTSDTLYVALPKSEDINSSTAYGNVKSGILKTYCEIFKDGKEFGKVTTSTPLALAASGTYHIVLYAEDLAGNISTSEYNAEIRKTVENTLTLKNIYDKGSGVKNIQITVTNVETGEQAITPIVLKTTESNITQKLKLSDGKFNVKVTITDGVGLKWEKEMTIQNNL